MIKVAFNKDNSKLVFAVESKTRVAVGAAGVKECYVGTLMDYSTDPVTVKENHMEQVTAFDAKWQECPVEITEADEDSAEDEGDTFALDLEYGAELNGAGIYPLLLRPDELDFNTDLVTLDQGRFYLGTHATATLGELTLDPTGYYITDVPQDGGWELCITDESAAALVVENGGFEGLQITITADAGICTLDGKTSEAFSIDFVYGEDLPNSTYPGDYTPEEPQS